MTDRIKLAEELEAAVGPQHGFTTRQGVPFKLVASHKGVQRVGGVIERKAGCVGCSAALKAGDG